jgi:phosphoglycolate phosphatase-like HAD superfamily hydrolase
MGDCLLFLDFDGVLCDSLQETLVCSWIAYHKHVRRETPDSMPAGLKRQFSRLRPFIRTGEDYIVLQEILFQKLPVDDQTGFDEWREKLGADTLRRYKDFFYDARQGLIARDPSLWYSLNPLFPELEEALKRKPLNPRIYILSTKKQEFILAILRRHDIDFVSDNVIDSESEKKLEIIGQILSTSGYPHARFIDDQIDHLLNLIDKRIETFLADWGYIKADWLKNEARIPTISIKQAASFIEES